MSSQTPSKQIDLSHILVKMESQEDKYMKERPLLVYCGTFNVNGRFPDESLRSWLITNTPNSDKNNRYADIFAIGFQEVVDLNTTSFLLKNDWLEREENWERSINIEFFNLADNLKKEGGTPPPKYELVDKIRMYGVFLLVYANKTLLKEGAINRKEVFKSYVATGIMDTLGNKGSVAISLKAFETRVCFVCSHFASDPDRLEKRNSDYRSTVARLRFEHSPNMDYHELESHDLIFWLGDLNYRIEGLPTTEVLELIYSSENAKLLKHDQLSQERRRGRVFDNYQEGEIHFRPTYKYQVKSDIYESKLLALSEQQKTTETPSYMNFGATASEVIVNNSTSVNTATPVKVKLPSWTDRVLWRNVNAPKCALVQYSCINTITISDHKPVYALFDVRVRQRDEHAYQKLYEKLVKEWDRKQNEETPRIGIENTFEYDFGTCSYYTNAGTKTLQMLVKNKGVTRASILVSFFDEDTMLGSEGESPLLEKSKTSLPRRSKKQWVTIVPQHKERIEPNAVVPIELSVNFMQNSTDILKRLNKSGGLNDLLIVKCANGNHCFATIVCQYKRTIMGFSLKTLSSLSDSFDKCDQEALYNKTEEQVMEFEKNIEVLWVLTVDEEVNAYCRLNSNGGGHHHHHPHHPHYHHQQPQSKFYADSNKTNGANNNVHNTTSQQQNQECMARCELYLRVLEQLSHELLESDRYFKNDLSAEYKYFLGHIIDRCKKSMVNLPSEAKSSNDSLSSDTMLVNNLADEVLTLSTSSSSTTNENQQQQQRLTIEERKNLVIDHLSSGNFSALAETTFDLDLLSEVLVDLLNALPVPLLPVRYLDYFYYASMLPSQFYELSIKLLEKYVARSHVQLLELIIKFLQVYAKNFSSCATSYHKDMLSNAIFQLPVIEVPAPTTATAESKKSSTAKKFVRLLVENHQQFLTI